MSHMKKAYKFHQLMLENKFSLVYEGEVNQQILKAFTTMAQQSMEEAEENTTVRKRVFHVMVEALQNIVKHSDDSHKVGDVLIGTGVFIVSNDENGYTITTGNPISNDKVEGMKKILDEINALDKEGLKELYKKTIKETVVSDKGGAGLGFIDIAKKTGSKIEYYFEPHDNGRSFFMQKIDISKKKI